MLHLIYWILSVCLFIGAGDALVRLTLEMGRAAVHAHKHDQMSYSKFTKAMLGAQSQKPAPDATPGSARH